MPLLGSCQVFDREQSYIGQSALQQLVSMNYYCVSHKSAFRYWLSGFVRSKPQSIYCGLKSEDELSSFHGRMKLGSILPAELRIQPAPLDVLVMQASKRAKPVDCRSHVWCGPLPARSICRLSDKSLVTSPEFTFLLLADSASIPQLVAYGTALCSSYPIKRLQPATLPGGPRLASSLTTKGELARFLEDTPHHRGVKKARSALRWVTEGAASPREAEIALGLFAPRRYGAEGLPPAELNVKVDLDTIGAEMFGASCCYPDFIWRNFKLVLEYDSDEFHTSTNQMHKDARRRNALLHMGYNVVTCTNEIFTSPLKRDALVKQLESILLHKRRRSKAADLDTQRAFSTTAHNIVRGKA